MKLSEVIEQIESHRFAAYMDAASGFSVFQMALESNETLKQLEEMLQKTPPYRSEILQRLLDLLKANDQPDYAHPYDVALASYLYVLSRIAPDLAEVALRSVLQTPRLWWARRLAQYLTETSTHQTAIHESP